MRCRDDLIDGEKKIEAFLTHLAVHGKVAPATQQAMNALVFLYRKVLKHDLNDEINAIRSLKKVNIPVVPTREETAKLFSFMTGTAKYGTARQANTRLEQPACPISCSSSIFKKSSSILPVTAP
jgi:hypothetical protein